MRHVYPDSGGGWKKYGGNPVLGGPETGTCFDAYTIVVNGEYHMHFSWRPRRALALVRSADGIHWSEPEILLSANPDSGWEDDLNRNCVLFKDGLWRMWYTGQARGHSWIGCAVSKDGLRYERASDMPVLVSEYPYEGPSVMNPFVMWDEDMGLYRMWYASGEQYEPNVLAYATSKDGVHWDKLPFNPIVCATKENPCEQDRIGACQVVKADGWHYMFYIGYEDIDTARICLARSRSGVTGWERHQDNPIVSPTEGGWDADACYKPTVVRDEENGRWLLWYNGRRGGDEYIGLVIHEGLDLGFEW